MKDCCVGDKNCMIYEGSGPVLIQPVMEKEADALLEEVKYIRKAAGEDFMLAAFVTEDWNAELSPWKAPGVFGNGDFAGGADDTLRYVVRELVPYLNMQYGLMPDAGWVIGGYSLAGLFALYCAYRTDLFTTVAAASPSVWFPGWIEFVRENSTLNRAVYLSLGDKEEKTGNPVLASVGDNIREMSDIYAHSSAICASTLEWNEGNHFKEPQIRTARAFAWALKHL